MSDWTATVHEMVQRSSWEPQVEEWEEDHSAFCITYTLYDGSTLIVWEDGRYEYYDINNIISIGVL